MEVAAWLSSVRHRAAPPDAAPIGALEAESYCDSGKKGTLPGPPGRRWIRLPAVLLLLLGPVLGLVFLLFLPIAGIVLIIYLPLQALFQKATAPRDIDDDDGSGDAAANREN